MSEPSNLPTQQQLLAPVRTLLQMVEKPFGPLGDVWQTPEQLLTELTPPLGVVDFSPFAQLTVNEAEPRQPMPKPPFRSTGAPPAATSAAAAVGQSSLEALLPPTRPGTTPPAPPTRMPAKTMAAPVFSLASQRRVTTVGVSPAHHDGADDHPLAQFVAAQAAPVTTNTGDPADHPVLLSGAELGRPTAMATVATVTPMSSGQSTQPASPPGGNDWGAAEPPLATMRLVATVVDSLLTSPAAPGNAVATQAVSASSVSTVSAPVSSQTGSSMHWPTTHESAIPSALPPSATAPLPGEQPPVVTPPLNALPADLTRLLTSWPSVGHEHQPTNGVPSGTTNQLTNQLTNQPIPDPWTLAQLINDVLAEEARRHGVDLS